MTVRASDPHSALRASRAPPLTVSDSVPLLHFIKMFDLGFITCVGASIVTLSVYSPDYNTSIELNEE